MVDPPVFKKLACSCSRELRSSVGCTFVRDAKCGEGLLKALNEASRTCLGTFDYGPVGVSVYHHKVMNAFVMGEICADVLERVCGWGERCWWCIGLGGGHSVAVVAVKPNSLYGGCDSWPEDGCFCTRDLAVTPWCAECNVVRTCSRRDGGMMMRSL